MDRWIRAWGSESNFYGVMGWVITDQRYTRANPETPARSRRSQVGRPADHTTDRTDGPTPVSLSLFLSWLVGRQPARHLEASVLIVRLVAADFSCFLLSLPLGNLRVLAQHAREIARSCNWFIFSRNRSGKSSNSRQRPRLVAIGGHERTTAESTHA